MSAPERWIVIPDWDEFQHYPDRDPIWIKNYRRLTAKDEYRALTFVQRGILHGLWLEYAASNRQLRDSTLTLTRRLGQRVTRASLESLNHAGFIQFSASKPLAPRYHSRASREERREEPQPQEQERLSKSKIALTQEARPPASNAYADELARLALDQALQTGNHLNGTKPDELYFARLLAAVGDTEENFTKLRRAARGKPPAAVVVALEACQAPTARDRLAVALTVLGDYGKAPAA